MNINTNNIIANIKVDLQQTIDAKQQQLNTIKNSYEKAQQFLLDNDYIDLTDDDDVIIEIMKCLKGIKNQINENNSDIKNISNSIKSLKSLCNTIDASITKQLEEKIKGIEDLNKISSDKLKNSKDFLDILLSLEILCPVCNGGHNKNSVCNYCDNIGVINISNLLQKENLLEVDYIQSSSRSNSIGSNSIGSNSTTIMGYENSFPEEKNQANCLNNNKFVISKK